MAFESPHGVIFTFNGTVYTATSISVSRNQGEFNVTSLDIPSATGKPRYRPGGLKSLELKVDWIGSVIPPTDGIYAIGLGGTGPASGTGITGDSIGYAICTGLSITAQAGDLIKGSATFKVSVD